MKFFLPLFAIASLLVSCSTAYQSGQTPDDVYFSPERPVDEYVRVEKKSDPQYRSDRVYDDREDQYLRMRLRNRLLTTLDDDWYVYDTYNRYRGGYMNYYSPWSYAYFWNYNFNPYFSPYNYNYNYNPYGPVVSYTPREVYNKPRTYNLFVFDKEMNNANPDLPKGNKGNYSGYRDNTGNYRGSGSNAGDFLRNVFSGSDDAKRSGSVTPSGSGSSGNSGSSSSGSSSSGSSGSTRGNATRGGN